MEESCSFIEVSLHIYFANKNKAKNPIIVLLTIFLTLFNLMPVEARGEIREQYKYSYYVYYYDTKTGTNVGPRINDRLIISVAAGETVTSNTSTTVSGTISFSTGVEAAIKNVVKVHFNANASGTITFTINSGYSYSGPSNGASSRSYYLAVNFDSYNVYLKKYDVYEKIDISNGNVVDTVNYYEGVVTIYNVKVPRADRYSVDTYGYN